MIIEHFISRAELDRLLATFAKPSAGDRAGLKWVAPEWWYVAFAFAKH
jgi:hypothetical protein